MERSLHRVSLGSRRAHPNLSFYLTTFGKCLWARLPMDCFLEIGAREASPHCRREAASRCSFRSDTFSGPFLQAQRVNGHHLLPGRCCQLQLVLPHLAGIIMPQFIFQRGLPCNRGAPH